MRSSPLLSFFGMSSIEINREDFLFPPHVAILERLRNFPSLSPLFFVREEKSPRATFSFFLHDKASSRRLPFTLSLSRGLFIYGFDFRHFPSPPLPSMEEETEFLFFPLFSRKIREHHCLSGPFFLGALHNKDRKIIHLFPPFFPQSKRKITAQFVPSPFPGSREEFKIVNYIAQTNQPLLFIPSFLQ